MNAGAMQRLLAPRSIALVGGAWADAALAASTVVGYTGEVWRVHPSRASSTAQRYFRSIDELPHAPDATFIAAPNREVPAIAAALARRGAGGFVCFAAGFSETATVEGERLTHELLGGRCERGVALICQSGTIALDLSFNDRSLPIGYVLTVGNQTRLAAEDLIELLAEDA